MNRPSALVFAILGAAVLLPGCGAYGRNRWSDARDIFTAGVGCGGGAMAQAGPVATGAGVFFDTLGLSGGHLGLHDADLFDFPRGAEYFLVAGHRATPKVPEVVRRGKGYEATVLLVLLPEREPGEKGRAPVPSCMTQVELDVGLFYSIRLGFNPGELLDFLLGLAGADIYLDDVETDDAGSPDPAAAPGVPG